MRSDVEWIDDVERFEAIADAWDRLATPLATPFALHRWYSAWWDAFGGSRSLSVLALWDGERLIGALPLCSQGRELQWMANWHSPSAAPLHEGSQALERLLAEVLRRRRRLALRPLPKEAPAAGALVEGARSAGRLVLVEGDQVSPFVSIDGEWSDYRAQMKGKWSSAERKARKMARDHDARFSIVERPHDLERQLVAGFEVEASGWKGRAGTAITSSPETTAFYTAVARSFDAAGELVVSEIDLDGHGVAFDLCLLRDRRLYLLKTGFDESYGSLSPGLVLRQLVVQRCFELGLATHELLGHEAEWKRRFATGRRPYVAMRVFPRSPGGALHYGYRAFARPRLRSAYDALSALRSR